jgi:N-acetylmuramic acid 6-phosphate etherase
LAGTWTTGDAKRIEATAQKIWPRVPCYATNDLETALTAAGSVSRPELPRVLIVSGTGSCCYGKTAAGAAVKIGGWGHVLGDKGSGYEIGMRALKAVVYYYDRDGEWPKLGACLLRALQLNEPDALIPWAQAAGKTEIACLAQEVFAAWERKDRIATDILEGAVSSLAQNAVICAGRMAGADSPVQFILAGSVLLKQPRFAGALRRKLQQLRPGAKVIPLPREGVWGAVELARALPQRRSSRASSRSDAAPRPLPLVRSKQVSPTEQRNPLSMNLDTMPIADAVGLMLSEDATLPGKILRERRNIERVVSAIVRAFRRGGRLFYVGAGTSGRLGVLDASECPATFRTPPELVQGIIAGGQEALWKSVEGAEDNPDAGARAMEFRKVSERDVVVGIAASGTTPFVWGALGESGRRGATTALVCFNPFLEIPRALRPAIVIAPSLGPEILTGSTRLKAGTATKLLLNTFTTLAMVRTGKVIGNLMVDLNPANVKLRDRAARIVQELTGADYESARAALEKSAWIVKKACARLNQKAPARRRGTSRPGTRR